MKYNPKYCEMLVKHGSQGLSFESFAAVIGVSRRALYDWVDRHEEFKDAKEFAFNNRFLLWEKLMVGAATGKLQKVNSGALLLGAKNVLNWTEKVQQDIHEERDVRISVGYDLNALPATKMAIEGE